MANQTLIIWFPNGDAEFCVRSDIPSIGERLALRNSEWIVARVENHLDETARVTVMPAEVVRDDSGPVPSELVAP